MLTRLSLSGALSGARLGATSGLPRAVVAAAPWAQSSSPLVASSPVPTGVRFATSKAGGSTKNGRDSNPKYLGVKLYGGQLVEPGNIIVRQRGARYGIVRSTDTVRFGRDFTVYATKPGYVKFWYHAMKGKYFIEVVKSAPAPTAANAPVERYPICKAEPWEVPSLLALPADTAVSEGVKELIVGWLLALPPQKRAAYVSPRGKPFIGGVEGPVWASLAPAGGNMAAAAATSAAAPAAAAAAPAH